MIKLILFDIDNTLLNHTGAEKKALLNIKNKYFPKLHDAYFEKVWIQNTQKYWQAFEEKKLTFNEQRINRVQGIWRTIGEKIDKNEAEQIFEEYLLEYQNSWETFQGVTKVLQSIQIKKGILSNGNGVQQTNKLKRIGLIEYFEKDFIFTSEEIGLFKPDPKLFKYVEEETKLKGPEILYIGDKYKTDMLPAKAAGWNVIHVDYLGLEKNFHEENTPKVETVSELIIKIKECKE